MTKEELHMEQLRTEYLKNNKIKYFIGNKEVTEEEFKRKEKFTLDPLPHNAQYYEITYGED